MTRTLLAILAAATLAACGESSAPEPAPETPQTPPPAPEQAPAPSQPAPDPAQDIEDAAKEAVEGAKETVEQTREEAEEKVEEVSQAARETMEKYIADLGSLGDVLSGVTSQFGAASAAPRTKTLVENLEGYVAELEKLAPERFAQLESLYSAQLEPLVVKVQAEVTRITSTDSLSALQPLLQNLPLLRAGGG